MPSPASSGWHFGLRSISTPSLDPWYYSRVSSFAKSCCSFIIFFIEKLHPVGSFGVVADKSSLWLSLGATLPFFSPSAEYSWRLLGSSHPLSNSIWIAPFCFLCHPSHIFSFLIVVGMPSFLHCSCSCFLVPLGSMIPTSKIRMWLPLSFFITPQKNNWYAII